MKQSSPRVSKSSRVVITIRAIISLNQAGHQMCLKQVHQAEQSNFKYLAVPFACTFKY